MYTASAERRKRISKKDRTDIYGCSIPKRKLCHSITLDESFLFYDSLVRRVWIDKEKRPIVRTTGSHKHSSVCLEPWI